jgi:hypothetical protein
MHFITLSVGGVQTCAWGEKNPILRIKNHVLGIEKLFLRALNSQALGKGKKKNVQCLSPMLNGIVLSLLKYSLTQG